MIVATKPSRRCYFYVFYSKNENKIEELVEGIDSFKYNTSTCYIPKGVKCPMELSTYFRINEGGTGQF